MEKLTQLMEKNYSASINYLNQYTIDTKSFKLVDAEVDEFNNIYKLCLESDMNKIVRTGKGTIARNYKNCYAWDVSATKTLARLTIILGSKCWCFKCGGGISHEDDQTEISGSRSFQRFRDLCKKAGIDLRNYEIKNGLEVKNEIEKPIIRINDNCKNIIMENVHHLDFNSSYPAGLVNTHPEFKDVMEWLYDKRKTDKRAKAILTHTIGYMQSVTRCGAKYAELSRDAINDNNNRIREMTQRLIDKGYKIVGYNTDGIWYQGSAEYHGEGEGRKLGEWKNDHINCTFRAKSDGAYEFIENGVYSVVYRGCTTLDKIKDRNEWEWGDIYKAQEIIYFWDNKEGFIKYEN